MITTLRFFAYQKQGSPKYLSPRQIRRLRKKAVREATSELDLAGLSDRMRDRVAIHRGFAQDVATATAPIHLTEAIATMLTGLSESTAVILDNPVAQRRLIDSIQEVGEA